MENKIKINRYLSNDDSQKFEFILPDKGRIECAYFHMPGRERQHIACISSQMGCQIGCVFCAAGKTGFIRNLTTMELLAQIKEILISTKDKNIQESDIEISFMGMGEPLSNINNVISTLHLLAKKYPLVSRITISTTGPINILNAVLLEAPPSPKIHLQISLHATDNLTRKGLMPKVRNSIEDLFEDCKDYLKINNDIICLNYILFEGINDKEKDIEFLANLNPDSFYIKITQKNPIPHSNFPKGASFGKILEFAEKVQSKGMLTKIFTGNGMDISASCGQMSAVPKYILANQG